MGKNGFYNNGYFPSIFRSRDGVTIVSFIFSEEKKLDDYFNVKNNKNIKYCQKMEQYSILSACIDVYYDISSAVICPKGKISKQT